MDFKYVVGQELKIHSKDRNLNGKRVVVASVHVSEADLGEQYQRYYKVIGPGIFDSLSFYEQDLEPVKETV